MRCLRGQMIDCNYIGGTISMNGKWEGVESSLSMHLFWASPNRRKKLHGSAAFGCGEALTTSARIVSGSSGV